MSSYLLPRTLRDFIFSSHNNVSMEEKKEGEVEEEHEETEGENKPKADRDFEDHEDKGFYRLMILEHIENFHGNTFISQEATDHFHPVCDQVCEKYEELKKIDPFCMCIAGGSLTRIGSLLPEQDIDVFFFGTDGLTRDMIIQTYISNHPNAKVVEKPHLYDILEEGTNTVSFIKKIFPNRMSIIGAFDLASCMLLYTGGSRVTTNHMGFYSHATASNLVSKEWYRVNETYKKRVDKYRERGFQPIFINSMSFDSYIMRVYTNLAKQQQIDIKCASSTIPLPEEESKSQETKSLFDMADQADLTEDEEEKTAKEA